MFFDKPTTAKYATVAILCFLLSGALLYSWATFKGIPSRSELQAASGPVSWIKNSKYGGLTFGLDGAPQSFTYSSKGNAMGFVHDTLSHPDHPVVTVLFDPNNPVGPIYSSDTYYNVFELSIAGKPFRTHDQIAAAWRSDENVAVWIAAFFALGGIYLSWSALRNRDAT